MIKNIVRSLACTLIFAVLFTACKKDDVPPHPTPAIDNIEIGLGNNEIGVIGQDFHFNADVVAGDKIENIQVSIVQRSGETYSKLWQHEVTWEQYRGAKNANVHKHFDVPADAPEGRYDFFIIVNDQNGTRLEEKRSITLYKEENLPVNPTLSLLNGFKNNDRFYRDGALINPGDKFMKADTLSCQPGIAGVKGDGIMYVLLINKKFNHRPEAIDKIDFNKAIVYDVFEHKDMATVGVFSNFVFDMETFQVVRAIPRLAIGADRDNNVPASAISGDKAWESGDYYLGVLYRNITYNINFYHYIDLTINYD
jgi:hypothetical protein